MGRPSGGLYVHLPFCPYLCPYCDFAKWPLRRSQAARYLAALEREISRTEPFSATTLFLGGGTPNTYEPQTIASIVASMRERFALAPRAEATIEVNPDRGLCAPAAFAAYRAAGITRVSVGVQSFVPEEIATLGRRHTPHDVRDAVAAVRAAGIDDVSLDLMFGVPGQTLQSLERSLDAAIALGPEHVSTYGLTVEDGTPYAAWFAREPHAFASNDREAEFYAFAIETLAQAGYEQYEISNFALPGKRCAHNANYWLNGEYLGLGVGAASYRDGVRSMHVRDIEAYCAALERGEPIPGDAERLQGAAKVGEAVMLLLRTSEGVDTRAFGERYGVDFLAFYAPVLARMREAQTLDVTASHVRLTERGRFVANDVCGAFVTFAG